MRTRPAGLTRGSGGTGARSCAPPWARLVDGWPRPLGRGSGDRGRDRVSARSLRAGLPTLTQCGPHADPGPSPVPSVQRRGRKPSEGVTGPLCPRPEVRTQAGLTPEPASPIKRSRCPQILGLCPHLLAPLQSQVWRRWVPRHLSHILSARPAPAQPRLCLYAV